MNTQLKCETVCRMILAGEVGLLVARESFVVSEEDGCNVCVFTLCCFLAECCKALAKLVRNKRRMKKLDGDGRNMFL